MSSLTEKRHDAEFLLSEAPGNLSIDNVTLLSGQNLKSGAVLGQVSASSKLKALDPAALDGSQNAVAILLKDEDASAGDLEAAVVARLAEVKSDLLVWAAGVTTGQQSTALTALANKFIIAR